MFLNYRGVTGSSFPSVPKMVSTRKKLEFVTDKLHEESYFDAKLLKIFSACQRVPDFLNLLFWGRVLFFEGCKTFFFEWGGSVLGRGWSTVLNAFFGSSLFFQANERFSKVCSSEGSSAIFWQKEFVFTF